MVRWQYLLRMRLDPNECRTRLESATFGVLATVDPDQGPNLVPVVFAVSGGQIAVPIDTVKPKSSIQLWRARNLRTDRRATLLVDHRSDEWSELWWVRANLEFIGDEDPSDAWRSKLVDRYPQYRGQGTVDSLLMFSVRSFTGWAAS